MKANPDKAYEIVGAYHELSVDETKEQMSDEYVTLENQLSDEAFGNDTIAKNILEVAEFMKEQGEIEDAKDLEFSKMPLTQVILKRCWLNSRKQKNKKVGAI